MWGAREAWPEVISMAAVETNRNGTAKRRQRNCSAARVSLGCPYSRAKTMTVGAEGSAEGSTGGRDAVREEGKTGGRG